MDGMAQPATHGCSDRAILDFASGELAQVSPKTPRKGQAIAPLQQAMGRIGDEA